MGELHAFKLEEYFEKFKIENYIETGTGQGISLSYALKYPFKNLYSIDIDDELIATAKKKFTDPRLELIHNYSTNGIYDIVQKTKDIPTIFFLDAHFPGADFGKMSYEESIRTFNETAFPLKEEIEIIQQYKNFKNDIIIIDDFIIYEEGDYDTIKVGITWKYQWLQKELNLETNSKFIYDVFNDTHNFKKDIRHQGYLVITPKL